MYNDWSQLCKKLKDSHCERFKTMCRTVDYRYQNHELLEDIYQLILEREDLKHTQRIMIAMKPAPFSCFTMPQHYFKHFLSCLKTVLTVWTKIYDLLIFLLRFYYKSHSLHFFRFMQFCLLKSFSKNNFFVAYLKLTHDINIKWPEENYLDLKLLSLLIFLL